MKILTREGCWLQISSAHHMMKIEKLLGYKTLRCTNTATSSQERWTRVDFISSHNFLEQFCSTLVQLVSLLTALKIILLYVYGYEKRKPKHIIMDWMKNKPEILSFINLDKYPICRATFEPRAGTALQGSIDSSYQVLMNNTSHTWILNILAWF